MALLQGDRQGAKLAGFASSYTGRVLTVLAVVCLAGSYTGRVPTALAVVCPWVWPVALEPLSTRKYQRRAR
jgi:hypothetical protein